MFGIEKFGIHLQRRNWAVTEIMQITVPNHVY